MAVPLQYQSQFVPTDFGQVNNMLGMYRQDMNQREQKFDQAKMMESKALAELYGTKTYDQDVINEQVNSLKQRIEEAVKKRGMDYGAASGDIASLIANEQSNSIWGLNTQKVKQAELLEQALANNPNLKVLKNPKDIVLNNKTRAEDINYEVLDPENAAKRFSTLYGNLGKQTKGIGAKWRDGYQMLQTQLGLSESDAAAMKNDKAKFEGFLSSMGQLDNYRNNPQVMEDMKEMYSQYVDSLQGGVHETVGMTPAQVEDRAARREEREFNRFIKLSTLDLAQDKANKGSGRIGGISGISGYTELRVNPPFKKSKEVFKSISSDDSDAKTKANDVLNRVITPEWIEQHLTPDQQKKFGTSGEAIIKNINNNVNDYLDKNIDEPINDAEVVTNVLERGINWLTSGSGFMGHPDLKESYKIKQQIQNEVDVYLKSQGDDALTPYVGISHETWDYINSTKGIKNEIKPEQMIFESGDLEGKVGKKLTNQGEFKDLLKNGFDIYNVYGTESGAKFEIRDKSTGNPYIVSLPPQIASKISGIVSPGIQEMEVLKDYKFVGNKLKVGSSEVKLPFSVKSEWKTSPQGKRFVYTIPEIKNRDYIERAIEDRKSKYGPMRQKLSMLGLSDEEIENKLQDEIATSISSEFGIDNMSDKEYEEFLNSPFETQLKSEVLELSGIK